MTEAGQEARIQKYRVPRALLWIMLAAMAASNALLIVQNPRMRSALNAALPPVLEIGRNVPSFSATTLRGQPFEVAYNDSGQKRVFLFFSPGCAYCDEQIVCWRDLIHNRSERFEILGLVHEAEDKIEVFGFLEKLAKDAGGPIPIGVLFVSSDVIRDYRFSRTPTTILVNSNGRVEGVWPGRWNDKAQASVRAVLGIAAR